MTSKVRVAVLAIGLANGAGLPALAQGTASAPAVVSYYPSFLDRIRAQTALEVIRRLPDFVYEEGGLDVGLDRNLGNVLINGKRVNVEGVTLSETLRRIPTGQVQRIDVVRGGAPGVDMQGRTVVANVIVGDSITFKGLWQTTTLVLPGSRIGETGRLEGQRRQGQQVLDFSIEAQNLPALGAHGSRERLRPDGSVSSNTYSESASRNRQLEVRAGYDDRQLGGRVRVNLAQMQGDNTSRSADQSLLTGQRSESHRSSANGRQDASLRYNRSVDKVMDLEASLSRQANRSRNTTAGSSGSSSESQRTDAALRYVRRFGDRLDLESRLQQRENASESRSESNGGANVFYSNRESGERAGGVVLRHRRTKTLSLDAGLDANQAWQSGSSRFTTPTSASAPAYAIEAERMRYEAYLNSTWKPDAKFTLEGGLRLENAVVATSGSMVSRKEFSILRPRLALTWNPDRQTQATINLDREVDAVNLDSFISSIRRLEIDDIDDPNESDKDRIIAGASALNPETRMVLRARYQKKWGTVGLFSVTAIHTDLDDIVDRVLLPVSPTAVQEAPGNIGDGRREQVNVVLDYPLTPLGLDETLVRFQATWRETEVVDPVTGETRPLSNQAPFEWEAKFSQDFKDGRLRLGVDVAGGSAAKSWRPYEVSYTEREAKVLVYTEFRARPDMTMRAEVRNITDQETRSSREVWGTGARRDGIVSYREDRATRNGAAVYASLRRTY